MSETSGALRTNQHRSAAPPTTYPRIAAWIPSACRPAVMTMRLSGRPTSIVPRGSSRPRSGIAFVITIGPFAPILLVRVDEHSPVARSDRAVRLMNASSPVGGIGPRCFGDDGLVRGRAIVRGSAVLRVGKATGCLAVARPGGSADEGPLAHRDRFGPRRVVRTRERLGDSRIVRSDPVDGRLADRSCQLVRRHSADSARHRGRPPIGDRRGRRC
jgi:hypothetical protein